MREQTRQQDQRERHRSWGPLTEEESANAEASAEIEQAWKELAEDDTE
jgi:hypothetical protein